MEFSSTLLDNVKDLWSSTKERAIALKAEANKAARIEKLLEQLHSYMEKDWPLHILDLLNRESSLLDDLRANSDPAIQIVEELRSAAEKKADDLKRDYPRYMDNACRSAGLTLDSDSRHPTYTLEQRFFQLKIDEQKWTARLSDYESRLADLPADVGAVVEVLLKEHKRIFRRPFNGPKFLKSLRSEYVAVLKKKKLPEGWSIPIRDITRRLGEKHKGFRTDEFLIDLSRLVEQGPLEIDGYRLDLQHTKDTKEGMLLHGYAGRGYIGFVVFTKVEHGQENSNASSGVPS
ncbi:MAG: hypothetical protein KatS3mg054_1004 [Chloroflexus sp.]|nr:MAG: hypothetical protein KatS3mg054_1004 [Chloroflexus sp.]